MERFYTSTTIRDCGEVYAAESELLSLPEVVAEYRELRRLGHDRELAPPPIPEHEEDR